MDLLLCEKSAVSYPDIVFPALIIVRVIMDKIDKINGEPSMTFAIT